MSKDKKVKMTGCIASQNGTYVLVDKKHPNGVQLMSSEDLSAHVGHKVEVKGMWEMASSSSSPSPSSSTADNSSMSSSTTNRDPGMSAGSTTSASGQNAPAGSASTNTSTSTSQSTTDSTAASTNANTGAAGSGNASALPQSDMGSTQAIRVSEIKMKSDKCQMPMNNNDKMNMNK